jgi:small-conductance mechanosensitive channel
MTIAVQIIDSAGESLGGFLPRLAGAIVLLLVGLVLAWLVGRLVRGALQRVGVDALGERTGAADLLERAGLDRSLSRGFGQFIRIGLSLVVLFAALSLLGLQFLSESLNQAVLYLPNLLIAALLLLAGLVLGAVARERVDRVTRQMDLPVPLGTAVQLAVVAVFVITAAAQLGVSIATLVALLMILLAAVGATFALAFGLGGREVARELSAGRYLRNAYAAGQTISVGDLRGEIVSIDTAATVLRTGDDETVRVPNNLLLGSVVTVHGGPPRPQSPA